MIQSTPCIFFLFKNTDRAKGDDTTEIRGIFLRYNLILIDNAKRGLRIAPERIQLVPAFCHMKIKTAICKGKGQRNCIRITIISRYSKHTGSRPVQNPLAYLLRELLVFSSHFSKHRTPP